ncbi:MAG: hypothetical protein RL226_608 [Bacteroidota bacterium]
MWRTKTFGSQDVSLTKFHALNSSLLSLSNELINRAERIVVTAHKSPDGDAVGSVWALANYLMKQGKHVHVVLPDHAPDFLHFIPGFDQTVFFCDKTEEATTMLKSADLWFALDYNARARTGKEMAVVLEELQAPCIMIDHHHQPESFPAVLLSDTSQSSTCQMVYEFIAGLGGEDDIDVSIGSALYCGIMTDTGSFRFPSVTPRTHEIAASLIQKGVDHAAIHRAVYDTNLLDRMRLVGYALSEKLTVFEQYHTAIIGLTKEELQRFNYRPGDTEGLVNQALSIKGVNMAVFVREGNNEVKLSFRSKGSFDVNTFARVHFNGGGHFNAAGGASADPYDHVIQALIDLLPRYSDQLNYFI